MMKRKLTLQATANSARTACFCANASPILETPADGWFVIAPYGEHPAPDGSYVQVFTRNEAEKMVSTWNSFAGRAARWAFNLRHRGHIADTSAAVWQGHPDADPERWPDKLELAGIADLRAGENGLEGQTTWNAETMKQRQAGPLKPSPFWMHGKPDAQGRVFPELLLSVGLVASPNISQSPAWTKNAPDGQPKNQNETAMTQSEIAKSLGLAPDASWDAIRAAINGATANATALATANATTTTVREQLTTANTELGTLRTEKQTLTTANGTLTTERDQLKTSNGALTTANATLTTTINGLGEQLALVAEKAGLCLPSEREAVKGKLTINSTGDKPVTAENVLTSAKELGAKSPVLNTRPIGSLATPGNLATANAAANTFETKVSEIVKARSCSRGEAWDIAKADPANAGLLQAMNQPAS